MPRIVERWVRVRSAGRIAAMCAAVVAGSGLASGQQPVTAPPPEKAGRPLTDGSATPAAPASAGTPAGDAARHIRFGTATPVPRPKGALRVAVYNIENLFDDKDDPALSGDQEDKDMTKPEAHRRAAAAAIRATDADIVALQEIESKEAVIWFRDEFLADMGYVHVSSIDAGDERGIEQSVLSRYPIIEEKNWPRLPLGGTHPEKWGRGTNRDAGKPIVFHRSPLAVTVEVPKEAAVGYVGPDGVAVEPPGPYRLTMFVVHQKSGGPGGYMREREAIKTVELVKEMQSADPDRNIIIVGDFNAVASDAPMLTYAEAGLIDLFAHRKRGDRTYVTHESGRAIDFVLFTPAAAKELIAETRFILGTPARPAGVDWRTTPGPEGYAADHYPVVFDLVPVDR